MDALLLSRFQFGFTLSFHILFPTLTIGLAVFLAILEGCWLKTGNPEYKRHYRFWIRLFALTFGVGVVSGIVLSYEFGTNFSRFSTAAGNIIGPLMSYEVLTAFFMEAGFLGVMLFGWNRVGPKFHYTATLLVALGTVMSTFWILSANSWMQTPAGTEFRDGVFYPVDWWQIVFNPSFPYRLAHMLLASLLSSSLFIAGVSAWFVLRGRDIAFASRSLRFAVVAAAILAPLQILAGDQHGLEVEKYQPVKVAAMEGRWTTEAHAPLVLFAWPDRENRSNKFALQIPDAASLIIKHDAAGVVTGLDSVAPDQWPNVPLVFYAFRVMVGLGLLMLLFAWSGAILLRKHHAGLPRWFLTASVWLIPAGFIATVAGWWVAEIGRQPWVVYGLMRTADASSPLPAGRVLSSLLAFVGIYLVVFWAYLYYLLKVIRKGPDDTAPHPAAGAEAPARPAFGGVEDN
ncbi:MAG TPA: cytochrome ubiquinol oxidase subunit I [Gammaproteobacteria bacterium]|nr:cytochrome ubiquinol oxidase subunit I [Gammaproteobacteria bacterium]